MGRATGHRRRARLQIVFGVMAGTGVADPSAHATAAPSVTAPGTTESESTSSSKSPIVVATPSSQSPALDPDQAAIRLARERLAIQLELELPRGCGSTAIFVERLLARLDRIRVADAAASRTVQARIETKPNGTYRATMRLRDPDGRSASRVVETNHCSDAIDALALITAVTLDPTGAAKTDADAVASSSSSSSDVVAPEAAPKHSDSAPRIAPPAAPPKPKQSSETPATPSTRKETLVGLGIGFVGFHGPAPGWMNGLELSTRVMRTGQSGFSPSLRLTLAYAQRRDVTAAGGIADFSFLSSGLELCPCQFVSRRAEIRGCALVHAGLVTANGHATLDPERHRRPFFALGAGLEAVFLAADWFGVFVHPHAAAPTARDTYAFDPAAFYRVSRVSFGITAGLETRFR